MKETISVQMTENLLYDFLLYHTYSKLSGFLINILGVTIILIGVVMNFTGKIEFSQFAFHIAAGVLFLAYLPFQLKLRSRKHMKTNAEYRELRQYTFTKEGILAGQEKEEFFPWEKFQKIVVAPKTFGFYYGENDALIIPKESFGEQFTPIMQIVTTCSGTRIIRLR